MAKRRIVWTKSASEQLKDILQFWILKTKSKSYSKKLKNLVTEKLQQISLNPKIGRTTNDGKTRIGIVRNFLIFYGFNDDEIVIYSVWDARRNQNEIDFDYT